MIKPLNDIVIIRREAKEQQLSSGLILPESAEELHDVGEIVAAGPGKLLKDGRRQRMSVKAGQRVIFSPNGHQLTEHQGEQFIVLREPSIIGVLP